MADPSTLGHVSSFARCEGPREHWASTPGKINMEPENRPLQDYFPPLYPGSPKTILSLSEVKENPFRPFFV